VKANFPKALPVGEIACVSRLQAIDQEVRIEIASEGAPVATIDCQWSEGAVSSSSIVTRFPPKQTAKRLCLEEVAGKSGQTNLCLETTATTRMFPNVARYLSPTTTAVLLGATRLVGIECPGLHSVFSALTLAADKDSRVESLHYKVSRVDPRFGLILINIAAPGCTGILKTFLRPHEHEQPGMNQLLPLVGPGEFAGQRALVIGGSRGLGELTAKLLSAGGAHITLTYHQGQAEAHRVVDEINTSRGMAKAIRLDVADAANDLESTLQDWNPTHLYYFASPFIFSGTKGVFSPALFRKFCDFYVTGFTKVVDIARGRGVRKVFSPSTVAIEDVPVNMGEYTAAKMAAEAACRFLEKSQGLSIYSPRLPRLETDQTATFLPVKNQNPVPIMLEHLRVFHKA
jgi:hypothetical protein